MHRASGEFRSKNTLGGDQVNRSTLNGGVKAAFRTATFAFGAFAMLAGPVAAQSGGTLKLGVTTDMSSAYADLSGKGSVVAVQMAIDDFGGTVLGKKIEVISADHQMKPSVGSTLVTEWFDRDGVSAVFGLAGSSVALAAQAIVKERPKKAILHTTALTSDLAGKACVPNAIHWAPDSYALAASVTRHVTEQGAKTWYVMVQDTAAGPPALAAASAGVTSAGGRVVGELRVPFNAGDVSSFVLQAQASKAQMVAIGFGGADFVNILKAAQQFGLTQSGTRFASLALFGPDIQAMGLPLAQGITAVMPFYYDINDQAKAWAKRFQEKHGKEPGWGHIADYEATMAYLQAVQRTGTDDASVVIPSMKAQTYNTFSLDGATIRDDMKLVRPMYLFKVKTPAQSKAPGDFYDIIGKVAAKDAFSPVSASACPLVKKS